MFVWFFLAANMIVALFTGNIHATIGWIVAMGIYVIVWINE